jgi:hypothetical protein
VGASYGGGTDPGLVADAGLEVKGSPFRFYYRGWVVERWMVGGA